MDQKVKDTSAGGDIDWVARARELAPVIEAAAERTEQEGAVPSDVMAQLHDAEMFRMLLPRSLGGGEADPLAAMEVMEVVAAADASTAWCLGQAMGCSFAGAMLDHAVAEEIFAPADAIVAWGPESRSSRAVVTEGGYQVTGKWRFASGGRHATWFGGHSFVYEADGSPRLDKAGNPVVRTMMFPREKTEITNVWQVMGLRGTGSDDYACDDLFVPDAHTTWRGEPADLREPGPLYKIPLLALYGIAFGGISLGLARATLDAFLDLASEKVAGRSSGPLRDNAVIQSNVAQAEARYWSARAFLREIAGEMWASLCAGEEPSLDQRAKLRVAITWSMNQAREVTDYAYQATGTNGIFESSPFERRFRDMHTVSQQGQSHQINFEFAGRVFLGLPPGPRV